MVSLIEEICRCIARRLNYTTRKIAARTLAYYEHRAAEFRAGTRDHDVSQNIAALLRHIRGEPPFTILDFGCGPGRDLKTMTALGHTAIGLDGSTAFVAMARADTGCEIWQQDFLTLSLPSNRLDGTFANASFVSCSLAGTAARVATSCMPH